MERLPRQTLNRRIGVEIDCTGVDLTKPLSREGARSLFEDLMEHKVVALRNTGITSNAKQIQLMRQLQEVALEGTDVEKKEELLYESADWIPLPTLKTEGAPAIVPVGPFPVPGRPIGTQVWHSDSEYFQHPVWLVCVRMGLLPRNPKTGEVLACGDTMWADMSAAWEDLPEEEKAQLEGLKCIFDARVAYPGYQKLAARDTEKKTGWGRLTELYPPIERPLVRPHPVTRRKALKADPGYVSHIVGKTKEESDEILRRVARFCELPEYQLRLPWRKEDDMVLFDNYLLCHRVVADFYDIFDAYGAQRTVHNVGTKGYPMAHNVLRPGLEVDEGSATRHTNLRRANL